jgi:glycosyltransferase involved in cell wall biosynthesis
MIDFPLTDLTRGPDAPEESRPRLLMLVPWFAMGGADQFNLNLARQLIGRGWSVALAATGQSSHPWLEAFARLTPDVFPLSRMMPPAERPAFIRDLIRSRRPDVVLIANSELGYLLLPDLRQACPEPAFVDFCHMEEAWHGGGYPAYSLRQQGWLDLTIVASRHLKDWMEARGADPSRVAVSAINIDPVHWQPSPESRLRQRERLGIAPTETVILFAGRICPQKQPRVLARVLARLARRKLAFRALVAGDGEDFPWLENFVRRHGLAGRVSLLGAQSNDAVRDLMQAADVFFLPSRMEGIALALYEAMAMGLAVVGADVGGQRELVTPDCGVLARAGSEGAQARAYAQALAGLIGDAAQRRRLGEAARRRVIDRFPLDRMGQAMEELLRQACDLKTRQPRPRPAPPEPIAGETGPWPHRDCLALSKLMRLENSPAGRLYRRLHPSGPGTATASPAEQLARLQASPYFKLIATLRRARSRGSHMDQDQKRLTE